jgi:branched-chain amino acid transport system substrate-binding protein
MKNIYKVIIGIVVLVLIVIALSFKQVSEVKIGAVLPLTGGLASVGEDMKNGMTLAMEETGLQVEFQDGEANPQKSLTAARQLVDINNASVILTAFRGASLSIASGLNSTDAIIFSTTATAEGKSVSTSTPNLFVMGSEIVKSAKIPGAYAKNLCKTVSLISEQTDVGKDKINGFGSKVGEEKVILREFFDPATTDFKSLIAKLKEKNSDCIFVEIKSNTFPILLKQLSDSEYAPQIFSTSYSVTPGVFASAPKEMLDKVIFSSTLVDEKNPLTKYFLDKYQAKYGKAATDFSAVGYEMIKMLAKATKACGDNKACIKGELAKISNLDTTLGKLSMESNQEIQLKEYRLFKISDGEFVPVN